MFIKVQILVILRQPNICVLFSGAEEKKLREASLAAGSRLKRVLLNEKEAKESLQKDLSDAQVKWAHTRMSFFYL